jgi:hypothetical protein
LLQIGPGRAGLGVTPSARQLLKGFPVGSDDFFLLVCA